MISIKSLAIFAFLYLIGTVAGLPVSLVEQRALEDDSVVFTSAPGIYVDADKEFSIKITTSNPRAIITYEPSRGDLPQGVAFVGGELTGAVSLTPGKLYESYKLTFTADAAEEQTAQDFLLTVKDESVGMFLHVSDVHYKEDYDPSRSSPCDDRGDVANTSAPFGRYGCDSSPSLVESLISTIGNIASSANFIIMTGDVSKHGHESGEAIKSVEHVYNLFDKLPNNPEIVSAIGNNDMPIDYCLGGTDDCGEPDEAVYKELSEIYDLAAEEDKTFEIGGYYSRSLSNNTEIIVLNTVLYSTSRPNSDSSVCLTDPDPKGQWKWLDTQLAAAKENNKTVLVTSHIPPGLAFRSESMSLNDLWYHCYTTNFLELERNYTGVIQANIFGHLHHPEFLSFTQEDSTSSNFLLGPSIGSSEGNNPAFRVYLYKTENLEMLNYHEYYSDLSKNQGGVAWDLEYSAVELFKMPSLTGENVHNFVESLTQEDSFEEYRVAFSTKNPLMKVEVLSSSDASKNAYCFSSSSNLDAYKTCTSA